MATSQNGYGAPITPHRYPVPGGVLPLRSGPAGELLARWAVWFHEHVEPLRWPGCWGYAYRDIRGATQLSNHASGTAIDLNAPAHPLGTAPTANFSAAKIRSIRTGLTLFGGAIRWGGDYTGRKDGMHFEIVASEARCREVLNKLYSGQTTPKGPFMALTDAQQTQLVKDVDLIKRVVGIRYSPDNPNGDTDKAGHKVYDTGESVRLLIGEVRALRAEVAALKAAK